MSLPTMIRCFVLIALAVLPSVGHAALLAGVGKVDITNEDGPVNDRLYARALVLKSDSATAVIISIDVVAVGEIGSISNEYLGNVRSQVSEELGIEPMNVMINASHCHGTPCRDVDARTFQAVKQAAENLVPVTIGAGTGHEDRIQENRRLNLKSGRTIDVRHAYSMPVDEEVVGTGPIDPEIGVLRIDRADGGTLAVLYTLSFHPIQNVPGGANSADITGFSSSVIEDNLDEGTVALFVQGCGGDINPAGYKEVGFPRDAEPLGNMFGLSTLKAVRKIETKDDDRLTVINETIELPRADLAQRIIAMEDERLRLAQSLRGTSLNLGTFLPLAVRYKLSDDFPSSYSHRYLHQKALGREHLAMLDAENRRNLKAYIRNIHTMEQLTWLNTNLSLLKKHQARMVDSGERTIKCEMFSMRAGDFVLTTFPGELVVQIGMNLKQRSPHELTFVAGYTNGYIYYSPTAEQLRNVGGAQEDSDCLLDPAWQEMYETKALDILKRL